MVPVLFETEYDSPKRISDVLAQEKGSRWCLDLHGCRPLIHGIAANGMRSLCLFEAPDAEALRDALRQLGAPAAMSAWTATSAYRKDFTRAGWPWSGGPFAFSRHDIATKAEYDRFQTLGREDGFCMVTHNVRIIGDFVSLDRTRAARLYLTPDLEAIHYVCNPISEYDVFAGFAHTD